jgi:hypothetical protein
MHFALLSPYGPACKSAIEQLSLLEAAAVPRCRLDRDGPDQAAAFAFCSKIKDQICAKTSLSFPNFANVGLVSFLYRFPARGPGQAVWSTTNTVWSTTVWSMQAGTPRVLSALVESSLGWGIQHGRGSTGEKQRRRSGTVERAAALSDYPFWQER